jgi:glycosyltransferase involved in cell wall biosynthesis
MQYASALAERGDTVEILALRRENTPAFEVLNGVYVHRILLRRINEKGRFEYLIRLLRFFFISAYLLAKKHLSKPYQVIHVHSVPDFLVFAAFAPKLLGARLILDIHDILPEFYASKFGVSSDSLMFKMLLLVERLSIAFSNHVIIANHLWKERLIARSVRPEKCSVFINYPDATMFSPRPKQMADRKFTILYPGSLNMHQGLDIAVRAFAQVANKMPGAEYQIYGEGPAKHSLIQLAADLGVANRVTFHDYLATREIAKVMANADLAIVPKRASSPFGNEAASTKILEFMSLRVPLIVSRTKIDSFYHDDSMVKFFESENVDDLASAIFLLWSNADIRSSLVAAAADYVDKNRWELKKLQYLDLVDQLNPTSIVSAGIAS